MDEGLQTFKRKPLSIKEIREISRQVHEVMLKQERVDRSRTRFDFHGSLGRTLIIC